MGSDKPAAMVRVRCNHRRGDTRPLGGSGSLFYPVPRYRDTTEFPGFDIIDIGRPHLHASGFFLEQERDTAVFVAPTAIEPLDGDLFSEVGDGHGHLEFTAQ